MQFLTQTAGVLQKPVWSVSANVGARSPNSPIDVQLVQFGFYCMGLPSSKALDPQNKAVYAKVVPGAPFNGSESDPLMVAIRTMQRTRGGTQDGYISPMTKHTSYSDRSGMHVMLMAILNNNIFDAVTVRDWPRIDKHAKCPPLVAKFVKDTMTI